MKPSMDSPIDKGTRPDPMKDPAVKRRVLLTGVALGLFAIALFVYTFFKFGR
jgi:hypothetical protein